MISRYARPSAAAIWDAATKYKIWFEIEAHAATKMAELGVIPVEAAHRVFGRDDDVLIDHARHGG
ncbi:MAG TPA: adenylosuccinate lyase, partial [Asticcacaulis sp.]